MARYFRGYRVIRFLFSTFGGLFSWIITGVFFGALTLGAVFWFYGQDLPNH